MNTNYRDQLQDQVRRFEEIRSKSTGATFADKVFAENTDRGLQQTFEVTLAEDPCIEAIADIHPRGTIASVAICVIESGERVQMMDVDSGSGLWQAVEVLLDDFRASWTDD